MKNYYKILNLSQSATKDEIKKSFRILAKKYHPDRNKDDDNALKMFQEVSEAYEILGDDDSRAKYDKKLSEFNNQDDIKQGRANNSESKKKSKTTNARSKEECMNDLNNYFSNFFGFDANSNKINKDKLKKQKNPIDTSNMFNSFFKVNKK